MLITKVLHVMSCYCYHKGTYFQANHNNKIFLTVNYLLLLLPQRYVFSSKSQHLPEYVRGNGVVIATTKVRIFKQITTRLDNVLCVRGLLLLPQRYVFSSKSQLNSFISL